VNTTSQLDLHPDAESLNAFAEQALAAPEREQVLVHLARCSRCRQVIFLAHQAAADAETSAQVAAARPTTQPGMWFLNWRFAWVPAAALAAALALVVTFHPRHTAPAPEMAKLTPLSESTAPVPQEQAATGAAHNPAPALVKKSIARDVELGAHRGPAENLALEAAPSAASTAESGEIAGSSESSHAVTTLSVESASQPVAAAHYQPEPAAAAVQQDQQQFSGTLSAGSAAPPVSLKSMQAEAYTAHARRQAASAGPRRPQQSAPAASFDMNTQQQLPELTDSLKARKANPPKLPSGLAVVSTAIAQNLVLVIDQTGALFLSGDSGQHWEQVARQWTGRAIEVRAKTGLSSNAAPAGGFELKNEAGSIWASVDGKTWTAQ
jgi:hypothetical protein